MIFKNPLENASIRDLVDVADANETYSQYAVDVFAKKFSNMYVSIFGLMKEDSQWAVYVDMDANTPHIVHTSKPFTVLEDLKIKGEYITMANSTLSFAELYPAIRQLDMHAQKTIDKECIVQTIKQLEHLTLLSKFTNVLESDYEKMLKHNSHIQNLELFYSSPKFLNMVNDILPSIKKLAIWEYNWENEPIDWEIYPQSSAYKRVLRTSHRVDRQFGCTMRRICHFN